MSKHTPGPWTIRNPEEAGESMLGLVGSDGHGFAYTVGLRSDRDLANARLIAAAPELLEALQTMIEQFADIPGMSDMVHDERMAVMNARDAVAKATGAA